MSEIQDEAYSEAMDEIARLQEICNRLRNDNRQLIENFLAKDAEIQTLKAELRK